MDEREPEAIVRTVRKRELSIIKEDRPLSSLVLLTYTQYIYTMYWVTERGKRLRFLFRFLGKWVSLSGALVVIGSGGPEGGSDLYFSFQ